MEYIVDKFIRYAKIETTSDPDSEKNPSTEVQFDLAKVLAEELKAMGMTEVEVTDKCYVYASLPANIDKDIPVVGFIAHMDTAPDFSGRNVNPRIVEKYDGGDIALNAKITLSPQDFPDLLDYIGEDIMVTDGNTLLGADDKAGVTAIMSAMEYLLAHPEVKHGKIRVAFTPDEEIGRGADHFAVEKFGAAFAYTVDGGARGELEYESFNAADAIVTIQGKSVHPGSAKNKMINASNVAFEFHNLLPAAERPEHTEGREGFIMLHHIKGGIDQAEIRYIIRDHSAEKFAARKEMIKQAAAFINYKYDGRLNLEIKDSYYNMREKIEPVMWIVDLAKAAIEAEGLVPKIQPIRGGTDGSRLSYMGLPCPNIFAGGHYFHGRYEFLPIKSLEQARDVVLRIIQMLVEKADQ
ncbi:peptidase T [Clostridiales bacterium COT073_COT-073]|nr:peptidase T [Clostridiales bacterium COT073_COT-073]